MGRTHRLSIRRRSLDRPSADADAGRVAGMIRRGAWLALLALPASAGADGGAVVYTSRVGDYDITVFANPSPIRVGPVDLSLYIQDARTRGRLSDATAILQLAQQGTGEPEIVQSATSSAATTKLFLTAKVD